MSLRDKKSNSHETVVGMYYIDHSNHRYITSQQKDKSSLLKKIQNIRTFPKKNKRLETGYQRLFVYFF